MKKYILNLGFLSLLMVGLSGCGAIEGIFKAGMWWGIIIAVIAASIIIYIIMKSRKND